MGIVLILLQAKPVGWRNVLEKVELDLICVLNHAAEAAISAPASYWSSSKGRGRDRRSGRFLGALTRGNNKDSILVNLPFSAAQHFRGESSG